MPRKLRRKKIKSTLYLGFLVVGIFVFAATGSFIAWLFTIDGPDLAAFSERKIIESTKIYDSAGKVLLYDARGEVIRTIVPFEEIPRSVKNAAVAIEDSNFYNHHGISLESIGRAFFVNLFSGDIRQGGSTITQQLVKKALLTDDRTYTRKIKEAILALRVERAYSKEEILNFYLNEIPYGAQSYGIQAASETFFGKDAKGLTLAEAAYLAALPKAPTYYSPYGQHRDELGERKNLVLKRMNDLGFISAEEAETAMAEAVDFISRADQGIKAPHLVMRVLEELADKYGEDKIESGGLRVITSLNWELQVAGEELTRKYVEDEEEQFRVSNAGLAAIDPKTGHILVMVGSRDYFDIEREGNFNVTTALRQPGSSIKPIVYAAALKRGFTDQTVVFDLPTEFNSSCDPKVPEVEPDSEEEKTEAEKCYHPVNYDEKFRGPVTFREALAQSINVPSVKVLYLAGLPESLAMAKAIGITTFTDPSRYGLSLVLGGGEVKLLEMVGAYSVFANDGKRNPPTTILKVEDSRGDILFEYKAPNEFVLDPQIARTISSMLSDNIARTPAFGANSLLYFPERDVAVKTGTTNDYRDAWVIGYTPNLAAGVWFGNNDNSPMSNVASG
ncbi:MAG: PBP1A family penicillin-binding protein, partial [Patescibacteria group bacterium]